jgi:hypothetical protein
MIDRMILINYILTRINFQDYKLNEINDCVLLNNHNE